MFEYLHPLRVGNTYTQRGHGGPTSAELPFEINPFFSLSPSLSPFLVYKMCKFVWGSFCVVYSPM